MSDVVGAPKSTNDIQPLGKNLRPLVDVNCSSKLQQGLAQLAGAADVAKARQGRPHAQPREALTQSLQRQGIWQTNQARVTNHHCTMRPDKDYRSASKAQAKPKHNHRMQD